MPLGSALIREVGETIVPYGQAALWWLGQMGYAVKIGQTALLIDAYLSPSASRLFPGAFEPADAAGFDAVLGSHNHDDHIDLPAWAALKGAMPEAEFDGPEAVRNAVLAKTGIPDHRYVGLNQGLGRRLGDIEITPIAAAHEFLDFNEATGEYPYLSYVISGNGVTLFHAGDTLLYEGMREKLRKFGRFDAMILPINGRDGARYRTGWIGNMTFQEAVDLAGSVDCRLAIPGHFDMFPNNLGDPEAFADYMDAKYPAVRCHIPVRGEKFVVTGGESGKR